MTGETQGNRVKLQFTKHKNKQNHDTKCHLVRPDWKSEAAYSIMTLKHTKSSWKSLKKEMRKGMKKTQEISHSQTSKWKFINMSKVLPGWWKWMISQLSSRGTRRWMEAAGSWRRSGGGGQENKQIERGVIPGRLSLIINKWKMLLVHLINRVVREKERLIGRRDEGWGDGSGRCGGAGVGLCCSLLWLFRIFALIENKGVSWASSPLIDT